MLFTFLSQHLTLFFGPEISERERNWRHHLSTLCLLFSLLKSSQQFHDLYEGWFGLRPSAKPGHDDDKGLIFQAVYSTLEWTKLSKNTVFIFSEK